MMHLDKKNDLFRVVSTHSKHLNIEKCGLICAKCVLFQWKKGEICQARSYFAGVRCKLLFTSIIAEDDNVISLTVILQRFLLGVVYPLLPQEMSKRKEFQNNPVLQTKCSSGSSSSSSGGSSGTSRISSASSTNTTSTKILPL